MGLLLFEAEKSGLGEVPAPFLLSNFIRELPEFRGLWHVFGAVFAGVRGILETRREA